ncbi:RagB/SusD family nutrient uptake outer membrane protein [Ferruginibacter paludis]|uniref:RagB/SusD family nutrient uptake outer membrane protein n=1 Tax=Ferruginibacter TaxID=1004303 RepID=UPI0025B475F8|nr:MULTISPECIES: RagB/SusD family nutrient uptake outer membrane protein [Ferruginibacter]MDB5277841.1 RagB/SusD protein [Ferruginibacter sp.]MDN3658025.1 RagB/SusD family nutrient uptake outer membrane protein [Ferruginibacter paludis]
MKRSKMRVLVLGCTVIAGTLILQACKKSFLDAQPYGQYSSDLVNNKKGLEAKLVGVYGVLDGQGVTSTWAPSASNWATAGVCADDAYKGTDANDQPQMTEVEQYKSQPANPYFYDKWIAVYEGIARANVVIKDANDPNLVLADADKKNIVAQARFLRGHYHFEAKKMWNKVPYIDETTTSYTNADQIWSKIEDDFKSAYDNLPEVQDAAAKANKWAAACYLAKTYMYEKKFTEAKALYDVITVSGKTSNGKTYGLQDAYWKCFDANYDNNEEEVFGVAMAASGSVDQSGESSLGLAFPYGGDFGCCGFFQPSQNLVNAYKTSPAGLPLFTTFNDADLKNDQGLKDADPYTNDITTPLDPRLDWSVGRRGVPYWDWGPHPGYSWIRDQNYAGPFSPKKHVFSKKDENTLTSSGWKNITAKDIYLIRYADVLLMAAEAEIEVGSLAKAQTYINQVRARAKNPASWVQGAPANYVINEYSTPFASQAEARTAVRFERRLELAEEGHRFFDLVRWGIAAETLNAYLAKEKLKRTYKSTASFTAGKNEYFPIPASIIDVAAKYGNTLTQNPGY